jgi:anti-sigma factor RsiW
MMTDEPSEIDLHAYVDDQLDSGRRFAVETQLSNRPALAAQVMRALSERTALRLLAGAPAQPSARLSAQAERLKRRAAFWRRAVPIGGAAMAAALATVWLLPARPPAYIDMAVASHRVAMLRAHMVSQVEAPALDAREIQASTHIRLPDLPADWRVTDAQLFPSASGPALLVAVTTGGGEHLTLFALRARSTAPEIPDAVREGDHSVAFWRHGEMSYALTGDGDPGAIDATAEGLNRAWS